MNARPHELTLWSELRAVFDAVDPVPPEVTSVAHGAMAFRTLDAELGRIVADTADVFVGNIREDQATARLVTFESRSLVIEVEVGNTSADKRRLVGQLIGPSSATVTAQWPDGEITVTADSLGRFVVEDVPTGPVRLRCTRRETDFNDVVTGWLVI
jgi:hypothetical protein